MNLFTSTKSYCASRFTVLISILTLIVLIEFGCVKNDGQQIPFEMDGYIFVKCIINDSVQGNFIFDTGCPHLVIDSTFNAKSHLISDFKTNTFIQNKDLKRQINVRLKTLEQVPDFVTVTDLKRLLGCKVDGILDWRMFKDLAVQINYEDSSLTFCNPDKIVTNAFEKIPLTLTGHHLFLPIQAKVGESIVIDELFMLDTGCPIGVVISNSTSKKYNVDDSIKKKSWVKMQVSSVEEISSLYFFKAHSLAIGSFNIKEPITERVFGSDSINISQVTGLIGNLILKKFHVLIDFKNNNLYLKQNKSFKEEMHVTYLGIGIIFNDIEGVVNSVLIGSKADSLGINRGDKIVKVDGKNYSKYSQAQLRSLSKIPDKKVELVFKRNDSVFKCVLQVKKYL